MLKAEIMDLFNCVSDILQFSDVVDLDPGSVGLALTYAVTLTGMFQWGVRQSAEVENMVSGLTYCCSCIIIITLDFMSLLTSFSATALRAIKHQIS